jgi:hypothetical protein
MPDFETLLWLLVIVGVALIVQLPDDPDAAP